MPEVVYSLIARRLPESVATRCILLLYHEERTVYAERPAQWGMEIGPVGAMHAPVEIVRNKGGSSMLRQSKRRS